MHSLRNLFCVLVIVCAAHESTWALIGDSCTTGCDGGMICDDGKCVCPRDRVPTTDKSKCLPVATNVGAGCDIQEQCSKLSEYTICLDHKCVCAENAVIANGVCEKRRELGDRCFTKEQCQHIKDASCIASVCACSETFVPLSNNTVCLPIATGFHSMCVEDIQCSKGIGDQSFCRDDKCQCIEGFHSSQSYSSKCVQDKGLSQSCVPGECYLPMDNDNQNIECVENMCKCKNDVTPSQDNQSCSGSAGLRSLTLLSGVWLIVIGVSRNFV